MVMLRKTMLSLMTAATKYPNERGANTKERERQRERDRERQREIGGGRELQGLSRAYGVQLVN